MAKTHKGKIDADPAHPAPSYRAEVSSSASKSKSGSSARVPSGDAWRNFRTRKSAELQGAYPNGTERQKKVCELWKTDPENPNAEGRYHH
ncbi:hypothetical protein JCM8097_005702 [Rhodosporidiobolus ruineniae]